VLIINKNYKQQIFNNVQKIIQKYQPEFKEEVKYQEDFKVKEISKNTMVLVVSDVHLGALKSEIELFKDFLNHIREGKFGESVKTLIINGDFFDVCMDSYNDLSKDYIDIYKELSILQEREDFSVIFILGNHEIPVTNDYNGEFRSRKKDFLNKFRSSFTKYSINTNILNKDYFCQYVTLNCKNNKWELYLYDSEYQAKPNNDKPIIIGEVPLNIKEDYMYLFAHGYQFEEEKELQICADVWASAIEMPDPIKELGNVLWNGIIHCGIKISNVMDKIIDKIVDKEPTIYDVIKQKKLSKNPTRKLLKKFLSFLKYCEIILEQKRNDKFNENILDKYMISKLTHVIFGHTHIKQIADFGNISMRKTLKIINDGSWQKVLRPSYVEIYPDGETNIMEFFKDSSGRISRTVWEERGVPPLIIS